MLLSVLSGFSWALEFMFVVGVGLGKDFSGKYCGDLELFLISWWLWVCVEGNQFEAVADLEAADRAKANLRRVSQTSEASYGSPAVDPLVVNFEEGMRLY